MMSSDCGNGHGGGESEKHHRKERQKHEILRDGMFIEHWGVDRVSRAFWPASLRRTIKTGKDAQRRRRRTLQKNWLLLFFDTFILRYLFVFTALLTVSCSLLVAALGLHFWYLLLFPMLLLIPVLFSPALSSTQPPTGLPYPHSPGSEVKSFSGIPVAHSFPGIPPSKSFPGVPRTRSFPGISSSGHAPETPMPIETPLIRVLETFDLREMENMQESDLPRAEEKGVIKHSIDEHREKEKPGP